MRCARRWMQGVVLVIASSSVAPVYAEVPTVEERLRESSLKPEYLTSWRSAALQLPTVESPNAGAPLLRACYRKDFTLPSAPRRAALTLNVDVSTFWFAVNGHLLSGPSRGAVQLPGLHNFDVTGLLRPGRNVLTYRSDGQNSDQSWMTLEGIAFCEDGTNVRILSDGWVGAWNAPEGWETADVPPVHMQPIRTGEPLRGTPDNVYRRPYYGPIQIQPISATGPMTSPIFDEETSVLLDVTLMNLGKADAVPTLTVEIFDEIHRHTIGQSTVTLAARNELDLGARLDLGTLPMGAYRLRFVLVEGAEVTDRRDYEVASVGTIPQRLVEGTEYEDGLELREVWTVDCTADTNPDTFVASHSHWGQREQPWREVETRVVAGPAGRYRVLADNADNYQFAYKYCVRRLYAPHLAVVEWPDDARRNFIVHIKEPGTGFPPGQDGGRQQGFQRSEAGQVSQHDRHPHRTNKMQKLHLLFWPNSDVGSIHVCNVSGHRAKAEAPAGAARITIYEILNDLPALRIADAGDRLIGFHTERGPWTLASTYYAGPLGAYFTTALGPRDHAEYYRNWYSATENWIKRMRFSGQNLYLFGHFMYAGTLYPSQMSRYGYDQNNYAGGDVIGDYTDLILRMFERNGMYMISGIEHFTVPGLARTQPTPEQIREGVDHPFMVWRKGQLFPIHAVYYPATNTWAGSGQPNPDGTVRWPAMNFIHPEMQERILALVGELGDLYGRYPAWKGVGVFVDRVDGPIDPAHLHSWDLTEAGYEDFTVNLFENETGVVVPVNVKVPDRFEQRYQFLMGPEMRKQWVDWRCAKYTDLFRRMRDRLRTARPDLTLFLIVGEPLLWDGSQEVLDGRYDDGEFRHELYRRFGFDLHALKNEPGIVLMPTLALAGSGEALYSGPHEGWRELTQNDAWQAAFANEGTNGVYVKGNIPHYGDYTFPEGRWLFRADGTRQGWFWSTYVVETFVNAMVRSNPTIMPHTLLDVCESMGRIQEQRRFAKAYRTLPNGRYERLTGNGRDRNLWLSRTRKDDVEYAYAANTNWWSPEVSLCFTPGAIVHDLIADRSVALKDGVWTFQLAPYELQTFRVTGGEVLSASVALDEADQVYVESEIHDVLTAAERTITATRERPAEFLQESVARALTELEGRVAKAHERLEAGDLAGAYTLISGALPVARNVILDHLGR